MGTFSNDKLHGTNCKKRISGIRILGTFHQDDAVNCNQYIINGITAATGYSTINGKLHGTITYYGKISRNINEVITKKSITYDNGIEIGKSIIVECTDMDEMPKESNLPTILDDELMIFVNCD